MKTTLALLSAVLMITPHLASAGPEISLPACTMQRVAGIYGFSGSGTILPGNPAGLPEGPAVATGVLVLDASGNFSGSETVSFNGTIATGVQFSGTYQLSSDCTFTLEDPGFFHAFGVAVAKGNELMLMNTDQSMVLSFSVKRIQQD